MAFRKDHPYLFFILVFTAILSLTSIITNMLGAWKQNRSFFTSGARIGIVEISGPILESDEILSDIKMFGNDEDISAIVVRIDSPGGAVGPSQEIYREIRKTREKKPVVASLASVAASGGYYIASAASGIMCNPGTVTGSIGVIIEYANFEELLDKIGLVPVVIKSGEFKDIGSPVREMTEKERMLLQEFVDTVHGQFINDVAKGRGMDREKVAKIADGRIFPGEKALEYGLVDRIGNFEDALDWAGKLAGETREVVPVYPPEKGWFDFDRFMEGVGKAVAKVFTELRARSWDGGSLVMAGLPGRNPR